MARALSDQPETQTSARWKFSYDRPDEPWECQLECMQCVAEVHEPGAIRQCRRQTCYSLPFCWQHLKTRAHLRIGRTRLKDPDTRRRFPFRGLFACDARKDPTDVIFNTNDRIVTYIGEVLSPEQLDARYTGQDETAPYTEEVAPTRVVKRKGRRVTQNLKPKYIDGACMRGVAALANDAALPGSACALNDPCENNARFVSVDQNYPILVALRPIFNGEEIFVAYGDSYWGGEQFEHRTTPSSVYNRIEYRC